MVPFNIVLLAIAPLLWEIAASQPTTGSPIAVTISKFNGAQPQANGVRATPAKRHQERVRRAIQRLQKMNSASNTADARIGSVSSKKTRRATLPIESYDHDAYIGTVQLGTPPQDFQLIMDSGSADLWVPSDECAVEDPFNLPDFLREILTSDDPKKCDKRSLGKFHSSTFQKIGTPWTAQYGTGSVNGFLAKDVVSIAGLRLTHTFGVAAAESESIAEASAHYDGICGLGKQQLSTQNTPTLLNALVSSKLIPAPIVSYKLPRSVDTTNPGNGEITFGALDHASYDPSTVVVVPNSDQGGYWTVKIDQFTVGGQTLQTRYQSAALDISTYGTIVSNSDARAINNRLGATYDYKDEVWNVPCNTNATMSLTIGGFEITLQTGDIIEDIGNDNCVSLFSGFDNGGFGPEWIIGDNILRNIYFSTNEATNKITIARPV